MAENLIPCWVGHKKAYGFERWECEACQTQAKSFLSTEPWPLTSGHWSSDHQLFNRENLANGIFVEKQWNQKCASWEYHRIISLWKNDLLSDWSHEPHFSELETQMLVSHQKVAFELPKKHQEAYWNFKIDKWKHVSSSWQCAMHLYFSWVHYKNICFVLEGCAKMMIFVEVLCATLIFKEKS